MTLVDSFVCNALSHSALDSHKNHNKQSKQENKQESSSSSNVPHLAGRTLSPSNSENVAPAVARVVSPSWDPFPEDDEVDTTAHNNLISPPTSNTLDKLTLSHSLGRTPAGAECLESPPELLELYSQPEAAYETTRTPLNGSTTTEAPLSSDAWISVFGDDRTPATAVTTSTTNTNTSIRASEQSGNNNNNNNMISPSPEQRRLIVQQFTSSLQDLSQQDDSMIHPTIMMTGNNSSSNHTGARTPEQAAPLHPHHLLFDEEEEEKDEKEVDPVFTTPPHDHHPKDHDEEYPRRLYYEDPFLAEEDDNDHDHHEKDTDSDGDDAHNNSLDSSFTCELLNGDPFALTPAQYQMLATEATRQQQTPTPSKSHDPPSWSLPDHPHVHTTNFLQQLAVEENEYHDTASPQTTTMIRNKDMDYDTTPVHDNTATYAAFVQLQQQHQTLSKQAQTHFLQELAVMQATPDKKAASQSILLLLADPEPNKRTTKEETTSASPLNNAPAEQSATLSPDTTRAHKSVNFAVDPVIIQSNDHNEVEEEEVEFPKDPMADTINNVNLFYSDDQLLTENDDDDDYDFGNDLPHVVLDEPVPTKNQPAKTPSTTTSTIPSVAVVVTVQEPEEEKDVTEPPKGPMDGTSNNVSLLYSDNQLTDQAFEPADIPMDSVLNKQRLIQIQETFTMDNDDQESIGEMGFEIIHKEQGSTYVVSSLTEEGPKASRNAATNTSGSYNSRTDTASALTFSPTEFYQSAKNTFEPLYATAVVQAQGAMTIAMTQMQQVVDDHILSPPRNKKASSRRQAQRNEEDDIDNDAIEIPDGAVDVSTDYTSSSELNTSESFSQNENEVSVGSAIPLAASKDPVGSHNQVSFSEDMKDTERIIAQELRNALKQSRKCLLEEEAHVKRQEMICEAMEQDIRIAEQELHELSLKRKPEHEVNMERLERELFHKMKSKQSKILKLTGSLEMYEEQIHDLESQLNAKQEELHNLSFDPTMIRRQDILAREVLAMQTALDKTTQSIATDRESMDKLVKSNQLVKYKLAEVQAALEDCRTNTREWLDIEVQALRARFQHKLTNQQSLLTMARQAVESRQDELEYLQQLLDRKNERMQQQQQKPSNPKRSSTV